MSKLRWWIRHQWRRIKWRHRCKYDFVVCISCLGSGKDRYGNWCHGCRGKGKVEECAQCNRTWRTARL